MTSLFRHPGAMAALIAAGALACGSERTPGADGAGDSASTAAASTPDSVTVPAGFQVAIFADSLGEARQIAVRPNGDVYLNTRHDPRSDRRVPPGGFLVALRDTNRDGRADQIQRFGPEGGNGGTGIAIFKDALYAEAGGDIIRYRLGANQLVPGGRPETVVTGLPTERGHTSHPFTIDLEGSLFVNSGSATNSCQEQDRQVGSPGERPCRELATRAGIWRFSASKTGQRLDADARYATGIRNTGALAISPVDGALYATQHGRDQLGENWPKLFDWKESAELPAESCSRW